MKSCEPVVERQTRTVSGGHLAPRKRKLMEESQSKEQEEEFSWSLSDWDSWLHDGDMENSHSSVSDLDTDSHSGEESEED